MKNWAMINSGPNAHSIQLCTEDDKGIRKTLGKLICVPMNGENNEEHFTFVFSTFDWDNSDVVRITFKEFYDLVMSKKKAVNPEAL